MGKMMSPQGTNLSGQGFFRLPSELRNAVYEHVLADVKDNVCIDLQGGANEVHECRVKAKHNTAATNKVSRLTLLLACKRINQEASSMAYSKMSMSIDAVYTSAESCISFPGKHTCAAARLISNMNIIASTFGASKLYLITSLEFASAKVLWDLVHVAFNLPGYMLGSSHATKKCTAKCDALAKHDRGQIHHAFHHIRRITIDEDQFSSMYDALKEGASWLSITMSPRDTKKMLSVFSNLEEIVVRRRCGEQMSRVIDGEIFAGDSGVPLGGSADWLGNFLNR